MIITNNKIPFINSGAFDHGFFLLWQHRTTILCETVCKRKYLFILEIIYVLLTQVISMESVTLNRLE